MELSAIAIDELKKVLDQKRREAVDLLANEPETQCLFWTEGMEYGTYVALCF